jgi:hypothetical protein
MRCGLCLVEMTHRERLFHMEVGAVKVVQLKVHADHGHRVAGAVQNLGSGLRTVEQDAGVVAFVLVGQLGRTGFGGHWWASTGGNGSVVVPA